MVEVKDKLATSREGRNSLQTVQAELFAKDEAAWTAMNNRQKKASKMLESMEASGGRPVSKNSSTSPATSAAAGLATDTEPAPISETQPRKRKRKHGKDKSAAAADPPVAPNTVHIPHKSSNSTSAAAGKADFALVAKLSHSRMGIKVLTKELTSLQHSKNSKLST